MGYDGTLKFDTSIDSSGFQSGLKKINGIASSAMKATAAVIGGGAAAVAGLGVAAIKVGSDFEEQMSRVQAISGATGEDFEKLKAQAVKLGADTAFSAKEAAQGMENLASAGFNTNEIMEAMPGMLDLAASSGEDLASSSDIAASTLRGFGLAASDAGHVADVLAKNAADTNAAVGDTGEAMKYVAPVAHAMGLSFEECTAAIGIMADAGIKGSQAGTTLRGALSRLAKPTKSMKEVMEDLGLSFYDSNGKMKSLSEMVAMLQDKMSGLTDEQKQQALVTLFGQESLSGMLALIDKGPEGISELTASFEDCDGAAAEMAATMQNNLKSQIEQLGGSLESLGIAVYDKLKTPLTETTKAIGEMADELLNAFETNGFDGLVDQFGDSLAQLSQMAMNAAPQMIETGTGLVVGFLESINEQSDQFADSGATLVTSLVDGMIRVSGSLWNTGIILFRKLLEGIAANAPEIGENAASMIAQIVDSLIENIPLMIQAGIDIVDGFIDGIKQEFPQAGSFIDGFFQGFKDTAGPAVQGVVDLIKKIFDVLGKQDPSTLESIGKAVGTIVTAIAGLKIANDVIGGVSNLFGAFGNLSGPVSTFAKGIPKAVEGFQLLKGGAGSLSEVLTLEFPKIGKAVSGIGGAFSKLSGGALSGISSLGSTVSSGIGAVVSTLGGPLTIAIAAAIAGIIAIICNWDAVKEFFTETLPGWWNDTVIPFFQNLVSSIGDWFTSLPEKLGEFVTGILDWFAALPGRIIEAISSLAEKFVEWGTNMLDAAGQAALSIVDGIVNFFKELPYKIGYELGVVIGTLIKWGADAIKWVATEVPKIIQAIVEFFKELPGKIWDWLVNTFNKFVEWGGKMVTKAGETAKNCIDSIVNFFKELPGKVWTWVQNTWDKFKTWGSNMVNSAKKIAKDVINSIINFFKELPGKIWTWLTNTIDKVVQWGRNLVSKAKEAAHDMVTAVIDAVKSLPGKMWDIGSDIVEGVWNGIKSAGRWFRDSVSDFFGGIVDGVKDTLGIHSPSRVFADEVGEWIPPGVGEGVEKAMPKLIDETEDEMALLAKRMQKTVDLETGKISFDKTTTQTYKVAKERAQSFDDKPITAVFEGDIHTHVDLDGKELGDSTTPFVDQNMGRINTHKKRGG
ncbi:phage tail tape measure protein [Blautia liquoris]|nr:phage tail tape measure protein [Blautia liquoris]